MLFTSQEPYPTMSFDLWEEAKVHYNSYAKHIGFSIKIGTSRKSRKDEQHDKFTFVCNRIGADADKNKKVCPLKQRNRSKTAKGCKARLTVERMGPGCR